MPLKCSNNAQCFCLTKMLEKCQHNVQKPIRRGARTNVYINIAAHEEVNSPETALRLFCLESLLFCRLCCS